jgi:hypothetical protein
MTDWIFLSKGGADQYINQFAAGSGGCVTNTDNFEYEFSDRPIVLRGILKHKIMQRCWQDHRDFYYMDTGYFGNGVNKLYHRIVKNDLQHGDIRPRSADRWNSLRISLPKKSRKGRRIIVAAPDEKPCRFYGIDQQTWIRDTVAELQKHTDRPIVVRERASRRIDRVQHDPLRAVLQDDVHALVTFNSNAAVESILEGVPVFVTAPTHAAAAVGNRDLSQIENPAWPDQDKLYAWACHLAYGQFHVNELKNGTAYRILNEDNC